MRKRFNRNAVCSSENYSASKKAHLELLKEQHEHFCGIMISSDSPVDNVFTGPRFKTIRIFGKEMRVTTEEYNTIYAKCNF